MEEIGMRKSRFTETQIVGFIKEAEAGRKVADICREHGISSATFYQWQTVPSALTYLRNSPS